MICQILTQTVLVFFVLCLEFNFIDIRLFLLTVSIGISYAGVPSDDGMVVLAGLFKYLKSPPDIDTNQLAKLYLWDTPLIIP